MAEDLVPIPRLRDTLPTDEYINLRNSFIVGCIKIIERGDQLPDEITRAIAYEFDLIRAMPTPED